MAIFLVASRRRNYPELAARIERQFPDHFQFTENVWLVSSEDTAVGVSQQIGLQRGGDLRGILVTKMAPAYYGLASSELWDWIRAAIEKSENG